jgi:hypothetical protein
MIEALKEAKRKFEEDRAAAQAEYEAKINEMREQYEQVKTSMGSFVYDVTIILADFLTYFL